MISPLKIATNSVYQILSRLVSSASIFLSTILITRNLSTNLWGEFVIVTSYVGLFTLISDFGLNAIFLKKLSADHTKREEYFQNLLGLRVALAISAIFLALLILAFLPHSSSVKLGIIVGLGLIILQGLFNTTSVLFQEKLKYELYAISDILGSLMIILLVFLATFSNASLLTIVTIFLLGNAAKATISLFFAKRFIQSIRPRFDFDLWKALFLTSLPLGLMLFFSQVNANIDKQIIALTSSTNLGVSGSVAAGIYGLSYRIFDLVIALSAFIANALYPLFLDKLKENFSAFSEVAKKYLVYVLFLGIIIALFGWVLAPQVLKLFGDYGSSVYSLRVLFIGVPIFYITSLLLWINISLNKDKFLPFIYGFAALLNLILNLALIPQHGYNAAAWVTVVTETAILILLVRLIKKHEERN